MKKHYAVKAVSAALAAAPASLAAAAAASAASFAPPPPQHAYLVSPHRRAEGSVVWPGDQVAVSMPSTGPAEIAEPHWDPAMKWGPAGRIVSDNDVSTQKHGGVVSGSFTEGWRKVVYGSRHTRKGLS